MNNAEMIAERLDTRLALMELARARLWSEETFRQDFPNSPHINTKTILCRMTDELRNGELDPHALVGVNTLEALDYPAYEKLPSVRRLVSTLMAQVSGERLGRVMVVKLIAGEGIEPHIDEGEYPKYYDRFHITLQCGVNGALYQVGEDKFRMLAGQVWWFQNLVSHQVYNDSNIDRINIIVDIKLKGDKPCPSPTK